MDRINKQLGTWGRYQGYVLALLFIPSFLGGCHTFITLFTLAEPNNRCFIPGFDNWTDISYSKPFSDNISGYLYSSPELQAGKLAYCKYCPFNVTNIDQGIYCSPYLAQSCDHGTVYDQSQYKSTLSMVFGMVCDQAWRRELVRSLFASGTLIGGTVFGYISDKIGRKRTFMICVISEMVVFNVLTVATNYYLYCILQFLGAGLQFGTYLTSFTISMELMDGLPRTIAGMAIQVYFTFGYVYVGLAAYLIRNWQWLQFSVSLLTLLYLPYYWVLPESMRWLLAKGKREEAQIILDKACKMNRVPLFQLPEDMEQVNLDDSKEAKLSDLFKNKTLATYSIIMFLIWFICSLTYYGLSLNSTDLPGDDYVNFVLFGISELPGYIFCIPMMERLGRKPAMVISLGFSGLACIASGFIPERLVAAVVTTAVIGKMCVAAAFAILFIYTVEVYPTVVRNTGLGFSSLFARIGSIAAPQIHLLSYYADQWLPIVIYGTSALIAALSCLLLPETKGKPLPESIEDTLSLSKPQKARNQKVSSVDSKSAKAQAF